MVYLGDNQITAMYLGTDSVLSVALGDVVVWGGSTPPPPPSGTQALKFTNINNDTSRLCLKANGNSTYVPSLETSLDGGDTWSAYTPDTSVDIDVGGELLIRASQHNDHFNDGDVNSGGYVFRAAGALSVDGPIGALIDKVPAQASAVPDYGFNRLFPGGYYISGVVSLEGIKSVGKLGLTAFTQNNPDISVANFDDILSVGERGMPQALYQNVKYAGEKLVMKGLHLEGGALNNMCKSNQTLKEAHISVEWLSNYNVGTNQYVFQDMLDSSVVSSIEVSCNPTEFHDDGTYVFGEAFSNNPNLVSAAVRGVSSVNGEGFLYAFQNCANLTAVELPDLVPNGNNIVNMMKNSHPDYVRFAAGSENNVKGSNGWTDKWGAKNFSTISVFCGDNCIAPEPFTKEVLTGDYLWRENAGAESTINLFWCKTPGSSNPEDYPSFYTTLSGNANGNEFFGAGMDYRFFNAPSYSSIYVDCGGKRATANGWDTTSFHTVSVWNCGFDVDNGTWTASNTPTTNSLDLLYHVNGSWTGMIGPISVFQNGQLVHDFVPVSVCNENAIGYLDRTLSVFCQAPRTWLATYNWKIIGGEIPA